MGLTGSIVVFVVVWWMVFFTTLPFGVRSQWEDGTVEEGTEPGAPQQASVVRKMLITTAIAAAVFTVIWLAVYFDIFGLGEPATWDFDA